MYQPVAATGFRLSLQIFWPIAVIGLNLPTHEFKFQVTLHLES
jgi:hypothetical protein